MFIQLQKAATLLENCSFVQYRWIVQEVVTHTPLRTCQSVLPSGRSELQLMTASCMQYWHCFAGLLIARAQMIFQSGDECLVSPLQIDIDFSTGKIVGLS